MLKLMHKKFSIFFILSFLSIDLIGSSYWQQKVKYKINISFDVKNNQFSGTEEIIYYNNSPDTLNKIFFHLYFNAFQPNSMMDIRSRNIIDPDRRVMDRIYNLDKDEIGYHRIKSLKQDANNLTYVIEGTILEVELFEPIKPNDSSIFSLEFYSQVPKQIRRSGRDNKEGIEYSMAQWFPKIAEYDRQGWHAHPYIAREFYAPWGNFDVSISINKKYIVAATGVLKSLEEYKNYNRWNFVANNVHDFVWAADPDYTHDKIQVPNGPLVSFYYQNNSESMSENWKKLQNSTVEAFQFFNITFGKYPYPVYSVIQAGDGGMEYPMATLITGKRSFPSLLSVTIHEVLHSWYQMILGTNESYFAWMDEGFASFAQNRTQFMLFNNVYKLDSVNSLKNSYQRYFKFLEKDIEEPLTTHSDHFSTNEAYGVASYTKGAIFLSQLGYIIGDENLFSGLRTYFNKWKFKHPDKYDFIRIMEKQSEIELDWYVDYWIGTTHKIDYAVSVSDKKNNLTQIDLSRVGKIPMPLEIVVKYSDKTKDFFYIPLSIMRGIKSFDLKINVHVLSDWSWVNPKYSFKVDTKKRKIYSIEIDPSMKMADVDRSNNYLSIEK